MVDTAGELIDGLLDMRVRSALLITAIRRLGGRIEVTHGDAYDSAAFDLEIRRMPGRLVVALKDAPKS